MRSGGAIGPRHYAGVLLLSLATLLLELALTRVLSVALWYHFGFLVISTALLGFGASGVVLALWTELRERASLDRALAALSLAFGCVTIASFWAMQRIPFDPFSKLADGRRQILYMPLYYLALAAPFFCSGLAIALLLTRGAREVNRLYAADLLGAGAGCAAVAVLMPALGGSGSVVVAGALGFSTAMVFGVAGARRLALAGGVLALAALALALDADRALPIAIAASKQHPLLPKPPRPAPLFTAWNAISRIDVYELPAMPREGWPTSGLGIVIDGGTAATGMGNLSGGVRNFLARDDYHPPGLAYVGKEHPKVLILGSGAGREVLEALYFGARSITAVEINPIINDIVSRRMPEFFGGLFAQPEVRLVTDEGRSFVRRSSETYDAIISIQTMSNAAIASGALALAESYMYTREAMEDYLDHLTPDGVLLITRSASQVARLFATAREVFEQRGLGSPANHLVALNSPLMPWGPRHQHTVFLLKKSPWTTDEARVLGERLVTRGEMDGDPAEILYSPVDPHPGSLYHALATAPDLRAVYAAQPLDHTPATDDRPFFNQQTRWSDLWLGSWIQAGATAGAQSTLVILLVQSTVVSACLILLPLSRFSRRGLQTPGRWGFLVYFAGLGLGFIMIEIALLQRFTLFLGQPVYTFAVVLGGLLVCTGLGSLAARGLAGRRGRGIAAIVAAILIALLGTALATPPVFSAALGLALPGRIAVAVLMLAPLGLLLGMPFPTGLRLVADEAPALIPWAWGVNGFFTVIGSVGAMMLGMTFGFRSVLAVAAGCYLASLAAVLTRRSIRFPAE